VIQSRVGDCEVGWALERGAAFARESDLIFLYAKEHLEFPPANNQQPREKYEKCL